MYKEESAKIRVREVKHSRKGKGRLCTSKDGSARSERMGVQGGKRGEGSAGRRVQGEHLKEGNARKGEHVGEQRKGCVCVCMYVCVRVRAWE